MCQVTYKNAQYLVDNTCNTAIQITEIQILPLILQFKFINARSVLLMGHSYIGMLSYSLGEVIFFFASLYCSLLELNALFVLLT